MSRVYPIRLTRKKWDIKLFCRHICSENCNIKLVNNNDTDNQIIIVNNPEYIDGKCENNSKIIKTLIRLSHFNIDNNSIDENSELYEPDLKVIPDNSFTLSLYFPFSYIFEIVMISNTNCGFTLKELINSIKNLYQYIYEEEERTSTSRTYNLERYCELCKNKDITKYSNIVKLCNEQCSICCNNFSEDDENILKLNCKHTFHENCIKNWFERSGTCPICRYNVFNCSDCDGSGIIKYQFTGIVIPVSQRGIRLNRNITDGIFGIRDYDFEDLFIENLRYDRVKKRLYINIV